MRISVVALGLLLGVAAGETSAAPARVEQAVAATARRSMDNVALDPSRKPAELLSFLRLQRGAKVADMLGANGYWAEIIAQAVGPRGRVTVWQPNQLLDEATRATFAAGAGKNPNVELVSSPFEAPELPASAFDLVLINLGYHDVYRENRERRAPAVDPQAWLARVHSAVRTGGTVAVIDHAARPGSDPRDSAGKLHRIDPAVVRRDFERAGFVLIGTSDLLANSADDLSRSVFDKAVRGKTDRFVLRFCKPRT